MRRTCNSLLECHLASISICLCILLSYSYTPSIVHHRFHMRPPLLASTISEGMEKIAALNAEMLARKEGKELVGVQTGGVQPITRCPQKIMNAKPATVRALLERDGCISIPNVLSDATADELLSYINEENESAKKEVSEGGIPFDFRFGGVNCRGIHGMFGQRQDMFLSLSNSIVLKAASEAMTSMSTLLLEAVTANGMLHEMSSLVADPGSPRQCIHADTIVLPCPQYPDVSMAPLYTFFIALQDVEYEMGHTVFLPRTHTPEAHLLWNTEQSRKEKLIASCNAVQSNLKKGDVAIFDSRLLHCGTANTSQKRRVLFYFTLSAQQDWPLPGGLHGSNSIRIDDRWKWQLRDFVPALNEQ